jgi:hypothetical protein
MELAHLMTPRQIVDSCPGLTMGSLRTLLFHSRTNGLESCIVRIGRKLLIDEAAFISWLASPREHPSGLAKTSTAGGRRLAGWTK